jgi:hypothetical protein
MPSSLPDPEVEVYARQPLKDTAAVNATRLLLFERLQSQGLPLETGTGGRTQWNRERRSIPKTHWLDASCVGASTPEILHWEYVVPWQIEAKGRQCRRMCQVDNLGFPRSKPKERSRIHGFRTGDQVRAVGPAHLKTAGVHVGRVLVRVSGSFDVATSTRRVGVSPGGTVSNSSKGMGIPVCQGGECFLPSAEARGLRARKMVKQSKRRKRAAIALAVPIARYGTSDETSSRSCRACW